MDQENRVSPEQQSEQEKLETLAWVLDELAKGAIDAETQNQMKCKLKRVYTDGFRHQYSFITGKMLQFIEQKEGGKEPIDLACMAECAMVNLLMPLDHEEGEKDSEEYRKGIKKLVDHISLESARLGYISDKYQPALTKLAEVEKRILESNQALQKQQESLQEQQEMLQKQQDLLTEQRHQLENQKMDFIAILGIFSGIVLAFVGGITFSNSALQGIADVTIYRLVAISTICGMVLVDTIAVAMIYVSKIVFRKPQEWGISELLVVGINVIFLAILGATSAVYYSM